MTEFKLGQTIETNTHRKGLVRYVGEIHVAEGLWLGIELPTATGKNDGSVRGERYFECPENHGLFVKETDILRIVSQPAPKPRPSSAAKPTTPRPASTTRPASTPKPTAKAAPVPSVAPKTKPTAPSTRPRPSSVAAPKPAPKTTTQTKRLSIAPSTTYGGLRGPSRKSSIGGSSSTSLSDPFTSKPTPTTTRSIAVSSTTQGSSKASRDPNAEALQTKIRHLEKQHNEDQELLKELNQAKEERDRFHGIIQKLQTKYQSQHQESLELKEAQKSLQSENEHLSRAQQEHETELELALLDKEMAEERYEQAAADAESLKARLEERELELDILRSEAELYTAEMSEEEKQAAGYYRLQHENDRLREALLLLKELKEEIELDHKARIEELEADLIEFEKLREQNAELEQRFSKSEATIEHLQGQLDSANESEEIIEELSGQNQEFREQIAEKDMVIKDLESLKELNDELEVQHIEQANELRAELESREVELYEQTKTMMQQETVILNQETLINKFRDLVLDLESKMTDAESSKTMSEAQMKDATGRFNEVMELNRRLRTANTNTTIKTITSELRQLQASEANEEIEIIKHYLSAPEIYNSDSLRAYFSSKRISFKSGLIGSILTSTDRQIGYGEGVEEAFNNLLRLESVLHLAKLRHRSHPIAATIASSTLAGFGALGPVYHELATVEKALDRSLDALKADEVHYADFTESLRRSATLLSSLATDYQETLATQPEDTIIFYVCSIKSGLEYLTSTFEIVSSGLCILEAANPDLTNDTQNIVQRFSRPSSVSKESILAANKLLQTLNNLKGDSLYPQLPNGLDEVVEENDSISRIAEVTQAFARRIVDILGKFSTQESGNYSPEDALMDVNSLQEQYFVNSKIWELDGVTSKLGSWNEHASVLMNNIEIEHGPAPWIVKAKEMEEAKKKSIEAEVVLEKLKAEHHATVLQIREREEIIDTKDLEIEHLRAKHREAAAKVVDMERLSTELTKSEEETMRLQKDLRNHQLEIRRLEERAAHSEQLEPAEAQPATPSRDAAPAAEKAMPQQNTPASFPILVQALSSENRWLRQREQSEKFGDSVTAMFKRMHKDQAVQAKREMREKQKWADEMLDMCMTLELSDDEGIAVQSPEAGLGASDTKGSETATLLSRSKLTPITLTPLKVPLSWRSKSSTPASRIAELEDLSFADLSPLVELFDSEIMGLRDGLSEFGHDDTAVDGTLEGLSVSSEVVQYI